MESILEKEAFGNAGCFEKHEVELFIKFENRTLSDVYYYVWLHDHPIAGQSPYRMLLALELRFEPDQILLLSSGEDTDAICVFSEEKLLEIAVRLQSLYGKPCIQRLKRSGLGIWEGLSGQSLQAVQLSPGEDGLYRNDAMQLLFSNKKVLLSLSKSGEGLELDELT